MDTTSPIGPIKDAELRLECLRIVMERPDTKISDAVEKADVMFRWVQSGKVSDQLSEMTGGLL